MKSFWRRLWAKRRIEVRSIFDADDRRRKLGSILGSAPRHKAIVAEFVGETYQPGISSHVHHI